MRNQVLLILEIQNTFNSRPLNYIDEDPDSNIFTPNHFVYGQNINEKCFELNHIPSTSSTDTQDLAASMKLILECYFKGFEKEYALAQEQQSEAALQRCSEEKVF